MLSVCVLCWGLPYLHQVHVIVTATSCRELPLNNLSLHVRLSVLRQKFGLLKDNVSIMMDRLFRQTC